MSKLMEMKRRKLSHGLKRKISIQVFILFPPGTSYLFKTIIRSAFVCLWIGNDENFNLSLRKVELFSFRMKHFHK